jgi:hypothetical protein
MEPHDRVPVPRLVVGRPSAVSTSLLSMQALDVDLHVILARPRPDVVTATTVARVAFHEERIDLISNPTASAGNDGHTAFKGGNVRA